LADSSTSGQFSGFLPQRSEVALPGAGAFNFNQYLIVDDESVVFHAGPRRMFPLVSEAVGKILPLDKLRCIAFSQFEADQCG